MKRVAITGIGCITPCGNTPKEVFSNVFNGVSGLKIIGQERFKTIKPLKVGEPEFDFKSYRKIRGVDKFGYYAVIAAEQAVKDSQITPTDSTGIYVGNGAGGVSTVDTGYEAIYTQKKMNPLTILGMMPSGAASAVSMELGITGPTYTINAACASSAMAIGEAYKAIESGRLTSAIAGGSEGVVSEGYINAWQRLGALAEDDCRPFAEDRTGFCLGEGSVMFVLEEMESAKSQGKHIYAEIVGYGYSSDASHWTQPSSAGQIQAIEMALHDAGLQPEDIGYCNAHATGTPVGDPVECQSLIKVWGDNIKELEVSSTKGFHGHMIGAAGAMEFLITILALTNKQVPANSASNIDSECNINVVTETHSKDFINAMSNNFAFGGSNAVLIASTKDLYE